MATKIIYFLTGAFISASISLYYFSEIINDQNKFINSDFQKNLHSYKSINTIQVLPIIKSNNTAIQGIMDRNPDDLNVEIARLLLASTVFLNSMTIQNLEIKKDVFLSTLFFYKKSSNSIELADIIPVLVESCKSNFVLPECTEEKINDLLDVME
jgi:hypothetical protein